MLSATTLWGAASAGIAHVAAAGSAAATVAAAGGAATLLALAAIRGKSPLPTLREDWALFMRLGMLEVANLALFATALRLGPLPLVVALHLTAPVILLAYALVTRRRRFTRTVTIELAMLTIAITLISTSSSTKSGALGTAVACVLAVASAGCLAALITIVATRSSTRDPMMSAGLQLGAAACLGLPLLVWTPISSSEVVDLAAIGAGLLGLGFAAYWWALATLDASTAGVLGLNEAISASIISAIFIGSAITWTSVIAMAFVLVAVALEVHPSRATTTTRPAALRPPVHASVRTLT